MRNVAYTGWRVGRDEVADFFDVLAEQQHILAFAIDRLLADEHKVAAIGSYTWHVKCAGRKFTLDWVHLFTMEQGLVTEFKEIPARAGRRLVERAVRQRAGEVTSRSASACAVCPRRSPDASRPAGPGVGWTAITT